MTGRPRQLLVPRPGQGIVSPLAGDAVGSGEQTAVHHDAAAGTGADDHAEHSAGPAAGTVYRLGQGEAVGVVGQSYRASQHFGQVRVQVFPVQPHRVGVAHAAGKGRQGAWDTDAHGAACADLRLHLGDQLTDGAQGPGIIVARGLRPVPRPHRLLGVQRDDFDLGATQIDSDANFAHIALLVLLSAHFQYPISADIANA